MPAKSTLLKLALLLILPTLTLANSQDTTDGGLEVDSTRKPFWLNISGTAKFDNRSFFGDQTTTASGVGQLGTYIDAVFIRSLGLAFEGGLGENYSYSIELNFNYNNSANFTYGDTFNNYGLPIAGIVSIDTAYLTYTGFACYIPNLSFSIGQVVPGFCLNCASSNKWNSFMERSMGTYTFGTQAGIGINTNTYNDHYSLTIAVTQEPKSGNTINNAYGQPVEITQNLWQAAGRFTWAPIAKSGHALQLGLSARIQEFADTGMSFVTAPEMSTPRSATLLNTINYYTTQSSPGPTGNAPNQLWIAAKNQSTIDLELLGIYKQWSGEIEYQNAYIVRGKINGVTQGSNLHFAAWHVQAAYILSGENRSLKASNGTFAQIKPHRKYGAWEIGARYSMITLDDHDINGGRGYNLTGTLSWYPNKNIKFMLEYVNSLQRRFFPATKYYGAYKDHRTVGGLGLRAQFVF